jgi:hypothetical protein
VSTNYPDPINGFWLPHEIYQRIITEDTSFTNLSFIDGRACQPDDPGSVTARYPVLHSSQWNALLSALQKNRQNAPTGKAFWQRLQTALQAIGERFADPGYPLRQQALNSLPSYTGYSEPMIRMTLNALELFALDQMPAAFEPQITWRSAQAWQPISGLPGRLRFYPAQGWQRGLSTIPGLADRPLFTGRATPDFIVGYGAGNVPGAALLIAFLALATTLSQGDPLPTVVIKNSRREPIFSPLILQALEAVDPDLVSSLAVLIWDYEDTALEDFLLSRADLVIAAASDETIAQIQEQIGHARNIQKPTAKGTRPTPIRFHAHGHKVSFSAIGQEVLMHGLSDPVTGQPVLDIVALLASLDSIFWDQNGCLSARIHFVEEGSLNASSSADRYTAVDYAARLKTYLEFLAQSLPRGAWPLQQIHDRFDRYKQLEVTGQLQVLSSYQDEFLIAVDRRPLNPTALRSLVNDCQGRVIFVRPVTDWMEIPNILQMLPASNLQSLSIASGTFGSEMDERFLQFAGACGKCGVTAIRTVGRGAFPQLSYSWDGFIPLDLVCQRTAGHFTTLEFNRPYDQILETFRLMQQRGATLGLFSEPGA